MPRTGTDFVSRERDASFNAVAGWANTVQAVWTRACKHDGIEPEARIVAFSPDNPFVPFIDKAWQNYREAIESATCFGYAGMQINEHGRAELYAPTKKRTKHAKTTVGDDGASEAAD